MALKSMMAATKRRRPRESAHSSTWMWGPRRMSSARSTGQCDECVASSPGSSRMRSQRRDNALDERLKRGLMKFLQLCSSNAELGSGARVVESISVECEQDLPRTPVGELRHTLCDVFLFESGS